MQKRAGDRLAFDPSRTGPVRGPRLTAAGMADMQRIVGNRTTRSVIRRLAIGSDNDQDSMVEAATYIQGGGARSTTAIGQLSEIVDDAVDMEGGSEDVEEMNLVDSGEQAGRLDAHVVYAQQETAGMRDRIDEYDNADAGTLRGNTGFHAEVQALEDRTDFEWMAASQPICFRCEALLDEQGIESENGDGHFTTLWNAPWENAIDEGSPYPFAADNGGGDGKHGSRWGHDGADAERIDDNVWTAAHPNGW